MISYILSACERGLDSGLIFLYGCVVAERTSFGWWRGVHNSQTQLTVCMMLSRLVHIFNGVIVVLDIL